MNARRPVVLAGLVMVLSTMDGCTSEDPERRAAVVSPTGTASSGPRLVTVPCTDEANWAAAGPAPDARRRLTVTCHALAVPRDHAHPEQGTLSMAVVRVRSSRQHVRIGSLVLNPGGPGGSGLDAMPGWAATLPDALLQRFDLVSFDPRGVGQSGALHCPDRDDGPALGDVLDARAVAAAETRWATRDRDCASAIAATGATFGTDAVARDLDVLRQALGDERLTYVGWSYGARLGAHYAHLFPDHVRALVLDSPPHPTAQWPDVVDAVLDGFEQTYAAYTAACLARDTCAVSPSDSRARLDRVLRSARERPIRSGRPAGDPPATSDVVLRAVLGFLPAPTLWPDLDRAILEADQGDSGSLYEIIDSLEGRTPAHPANDSDVMRDAVFCTDTRELSDERLRAAAPGIASSHPTFGAYGAWWLYQCATWAAPREPLPVPTSTTRGDVLVIGGSADPSTPLAGARALAEVIGRAATLLVSGTPGHTSFGRSDCVAAHVVRLLVRAQRPAAESRCA